MLKRLFGFNPQETTIRTEIMAGVTTFLTMAYILAVNPNILGETGMDKGALFTTTVLMAGLSTLFMGLYAKLPLALAPGMGFLPIQSAWSWAIHGSLRLRRYSLRG